MRRQVFPTAPSPITTNLIVCVAIIIVNIALLLWELISIVEGGFPTNPGFIVLEVLVNFALLSEVLLRLVAMHRRFCQYWGNVFDVFVLILSLLAMVLYFTGESLFKDIEEGFSLILLSCRYVIALLRVAILVKNQGSYLTTSASQRIDFSKVGPDPENPANPEEVVVEMKGKHERDSWDSNDEEDL